MPQSSGKILSPKKEAQKKQEKKFTRLIIPLLPFTLLISSCVVTSDETGSNSDDQEILEENSQTPENSMESEPLATTVSSSTEIGQDFVLSVLSLEVVGSGLLRLTVEIHNNSTKNINLIDGMGEPDDPNTGRNITLLDTTSKNRHFSYKLSDGSCFCSALDGPVGAGQSEELWIIFPAPPSDVQFMTVTTPLTPPLFDIPITDSSETIENDGLEPAEISPLTIISDDLEDQTGRTEDNDSVSIILSSDVLFETSSSELTSKAEEILQEVAAEINAEAPETINIDGYADNTGTDSTNIPLSQERAESVEEELSEQTENSSIEFEVEGHGSADPIADNDTEEGRERNRRVSVTFKK